MRAEPSATGEVPLVLVGLRCSGKTSVGRELALRLERPLVDLDDTVACDVQLASAGEVILQHGLARFREFEREALARVLETPGGAIVAAGGGVVEDPENRALLAARARAIWLRAAPAVLRARMERDPVLRPALTGEDPLSEIEALAARREAFYRQVASLAVDTDGLDAAGVALEIARRL